jgi:hypothetical protein
MPHSLIDLHMHSTASDGRLTPIELVDRVAAAGVALMALTDHDTLAGLDQAQQAAGQAGVGFVPGIELSARWARGVVHILCSSMASPPNKRGVTSALSVSVSD